MNRSLAAPTASPGRVIAVLGPTNTGKTHLALERLLGHRSGMIGFPLRLLARENYDRIVRLKGARSVALITGEEKILPPTAQWFVCTVEAMPTDRAVDFLAIDEIQLCADPERGHIFTERLLKARGLCETMFLGAESIKPLLRRLVPGVEFIVRPRLSQLTYAGSRKLTRLPPRSAIVAFSAAEVYALAELIRRQRGGAAVVLGALSPRARNAQVALYQAGEVDYLVATDAIGMGLNMDVDHVAFSSLRKFDGRHPRLLDSAEVAQIAGRAGRHMNDGSFGATGDLPGLDAALVDAVENHQFPPLKRLQWRNSDLRFTSVEALLASLERKPDLPGLMRARDADDHLALQTLSHDPEILALARGPDRVRLLWEVCRIPDFRKGLAEQHSKLQAVLFRHLTTAPGKLPPDWLQAQIQRIDKTDGDIDLLMTRIANIRTWTYISQRPDWVADIGHWQDRTRAIEDRLSDALHERLTQRFVDRRTALLVRRMKDQDSLMSVVRDDGAVHVEGQFVGMLRGFQFEPDRADNDHAARAVAAAAARALRGDIDQRVLRFTAAPDTAFAISDQGRLLWEDAPVASLRGDPDILRPQIELLPSDLLDATARSRLHGRLSDWLSARLRQGPLAPLFTLRAAPLSGGARGIAFQLGEGLGSLRRETCQAVIATLSAADRQSLRRLGVQIGQDSLFLPALLKPAAQAERAMLWAVRHGLPRPALPTPGRIWVAATAPADFYAAIGFHTAGRLAVRIDIWERMRDTIRTLSRHGPWQATPALHGILQLPPAELTALLAAMGYRAATGDDQKVIFSQHARPTSARPARRKISNLESPFAMLRGRISG